MEYYPLLLERHLDGRIWGGKKLASFLNLPEPHPERIAESWQVFDTNRVLNGRLAGMTLAQVTAQQGAGLVGTLSLPRYGADFPLLAKFIDAAQDLSVQVHPDDTYAHKVESETGFHGKNEAWYILDARPGADIFYHLARPVTRAEFAAAVAAGEVTALLNRRPVHPGDVIFVPAGTLHTINAGITLFEIQQKSDLTYRVYDYGRGRPLHLDKALDVIAFHKPPPPLVKPLALDAAGCRMLLLATPHFALERWQLDQPAPGETRPTSLEIITAIAGRGGLSWDGGDLALSQGTSVVLPAALGSTTIHPQGALTLLRCTIPHLERDLREPLRRLGHSPAQINRVIVDSFGM